MPDARCEWRAPDAQRTHHHHALRRSLAFRLPPPSDSDGRARTQVIVHVWKDVTNVTEVLAGGYDVIRNVGYDKTSWCAQLVPPHAPRACEGFSSAHAIVRACTS